MKPHYAFLTIQSRAHPGLWIRVVLGINKEGDRYWELREKNSGGFLEFPEKGWWIHYEGSPYTVLKGSSGSTDPLSGILLTGNFEQYFEKLCGEEMFGEGFRASRDREKPDVDYLFRLPPCT